MRIAVAGFMHESNTFVPTTTGWPLFLEGSVTHGDELIRVWGQAHHEVGGFLQGASRYGYEVVPSLMAWATPSGTVTDDVLDRVVNTIADDCSRHPIDGLLLALHGAMVTQSYPDADAEVLRRLRQKLGPDLPIVTTLDFHGNVPPVLATLSQVIVGYQTYPHIDQREVGLRAANLISRFVSGHINPVTAIAKPPLLANLLGQETDCEPMLSLMAAARAAEALTGVLSVSLMAGFPYADVPEIGPSVIAVTDNDQALAHQVASDLADQLWNRRQELTVNCPTAQQAVAQAIASDTRPVVLVDLGDNIGGGTPGDGTLLLSELIRQKARHAVVVLHDPEAASEAASIGVGGSFERAVGGQSGPLYHVPTPLKGVVKTLHVGQWTETEARHGGRRGNDQGPTAVVEIPGPILVVLNTLRTPPFSLGQLTSLGIDPASQHILVAKAAVAYKAAYAPLNPRVIEVDTPGYTAIDPRRFDYQHARQRLYPLTS